MDLAERYAKIEARRLDACAQAGREPDTVTLIAVSKTHPPERIEEAQRLGQVHFGESYAQELRDKARTNPSPLWHYIGRIQTNKARHIAPVAYRVHALETVRQAEAMVARASGPLHALMSVNIGRESSKGGVLPEQAIEQAKTLSRVEGIVLCGLMAMPPVFEDPEDTDPFFAEVAQLARDGQREGLPLHELSMGMSHDFHVAIRHGATWIRVGTALFGARQIRR